MHNVYSALWCRYRDAIKDLQRALEMSAANEKDVVAAKLKEAQDGAAAQPAAVEPVPAKQPAAPSATSSSHTDRPSDRGDGTASSSQPEASKAVEDGHVSDADSDGVEEIPVSAGAAQQEAVQQAAGSMPAGPRGMPPGMDPAQMQSMMQDPGMMRQMADMMGSMDPAQMESMARMAGMPGTEACFQHDVSTHALPMLLQSPTA